MKSDFEVQSVTQHKQGVAISLQGEQNGLSKVLGQITLNLTAAEAKSLSVSPGDKLTVTVGK